MSIKNYKFHVKISDPMPDLVWEQAKQSNNLWNAFVEIRKNFLERIKPLYEKEVTTEQLLPFTIDREIELADLKKAIKEIKNYEFKDFEKSLVEITRKDEWKVVLGWEAREAVFERFKTASTSSLKIGGEVNIKRNLSQSGINFYHRFTAGGWDTTKIFESRSKKLQFNQLNDELFLNNSHQNRKGRISSGIFGIGIGDFPLEISVLFHRQLPIGKIKTAQLVGEFEELTKTWHWNLVLAVQTDDESIPLATDKPAAALDLNWRRLDDDLRIGYLIDTDGNRFEIRLPLIEGISRRAKNTIRKINDARRYKNQKPLEFKDIFPTNLLEIAEWSNKVDELKDSIKTTIKTKYENFEAKEEHHKNFLQYFNKIGRRGLLRLFYTLEKLSEENLITDVDHNLLLDLKEWKTEDYRLRLAIHKTHKYLTDKRKKRYENIAIWFRKEFSQLVWEGDLNLKAMAEAAPKISLNSDKVAIKLGNKYRQYAGLSILRGKIKEQNTNSNWLINAKGAKTTTTCRLCGEQATSTASLLITCPNGHEIDQDAQSCFNLLGTLSNSATIDKTKRKINIPQHLENLIIPTI